MEAKVFILAILLWTVKSLLEKGNLEIEVDSNTSKTVKTTNSEGKVSDLIPYSSYMYSLSWAGSLCAFHKCSHYGIDGIYNLHGLWPDASSGPNPFECYQTYFRESDYDAELRSEIYDYWNSFYNPNWGFIKHEIEKHGTCWDPAAGDKSKMDPKIKKILDTVNTDDDISKLNVYLKIAIQISKNLNPYATLKANGIVPGENKEFDIDDVIAIYDQIYGQYSVIPICLTDRASNQLYMTEFRFCLDLNYNPQQCKNIDFVKSKIQICKKQKITYPPFPN
jgi:ribonuclease I